MVSIFSTVKYSGVRFKGGTAQCSTRAGSFLTRRMLASKKHSSLSLKRLDYKEKSFITLGPGTNLGLDSPFTVAGERDN